MALVSNTQMNVEHNTELFALAVAFYKSQSQTLTICSTTFSCNGVSNALPEKIDARQAVVT